MDIDDSSSSEDVIIVSRPKKRKKKKTRGKSKPSGPKRKPMKTLRSWVSRHDTYSVYEDLQNDDALQSYFANKKTGLEFTSDQKLWCTYCNKFVSEDKYVNLRKHFGFAGAACSKGHSASLNSAMVQGNSRHQEIRHKRKHAPIKEVKQEFRRDFVFDMLQGGINASQAVYVRKTHVEWGRDGYGNSLPEDLYPVFEEQFDSCMDRMWTELFPADEQVFHHLCVDPGTDNAKNKMSVVSTQFNFETAAVTRGKREAKNDESMQLLFGEKSLSLIHSLSRPASANRIKDIQRVEKGQIVPL